MARVLVTCSWCHESNELDRVRKTYCFNCAHRADVPRIECDCRRCRMRSAEKAERGKARAAA